MFFYQLHNKVLISQKRYLEYKSISQKEVETCEDIAYVITKMDPMKSRRSFCISDPSLMFLEEEGIQLLSKKREETSEFPKWIKKKINEKKLTSVNIEYPRWQEVLSYQVPSKCRIQIVGLGDVGGVLLTGLRLLGGKHIDSIGIFDKNIKAMKRWDFEANQIYYSSGMLTFPEVYPVNEKNIFDCDVFIFCATTGVPSLGNENKDVRMSQFKGNSEIISIYARKAREKSFKGLFAVLSDPVDLLCKHVFLISNKNNLGQFDFRGLAPEQIRGYGLGVMNARAAYYAKKNPKFLRYLKEGRAFGPHGDGLIIADSIKNYNEKLSADLTIRTIQANLEVRKAGFKPFVAPALSSGCFPIIATLGGKWHYSATFMGGVFMGARNRMHKSGTEIEKLHLSSALMEKISDSYNKLKKFL